MVKDMNVEEDSNLSVSCGNGKLRQWLIDQIDSHGYPGLVWENDEKTIFRIPWKHAGKQDYNRDEDAALFKAWALFKGKYREGVDKPDPPTWKTRLRCALNKSNDFDELVDKSQLDISDPYKVYRIIPEGAKRGMKMGNVEDSMSHTNSLSYTLPPYASLQNQVPGYMPFQDRKDWREYPPEHPPLPPPLLLPPPPPPHQPLHGELQFGQCHYPPLGRPWPSDNGYQITGSFYSYTPTESHATSYTVDHSTAISDCGLHVSLFYREFLVKEVTTSSPGGCRITSSPPSTSSSSSSSSPSSPSSPLPGAEERPGGAETILFPSPYPQSQRRGADKLTNVLERGVLLWMAADGLYGRRLCQGRVYWEGPLAPHTDKPNKLEKEQTCKLFDTQLFLNELQGYIHHGRPMPRHQVVLCFGDEYPDPQRQRKMITAQVEPMFARKLVYYSQQSSGAYLRGYDLQTQEPSPPGDYQRNLQHSLDL
ncbi:LOW QUALITY PROTEIN: interferon regulatory factor 4a [Osmerus eperlanus]|uniref:LOW QUALITY PROTEIN: interferon regulatory factor 4a n=1 Tax=Osmerus eperlanus TaxID=29151 RepID=UPI002E152C16